MNVLVDLFAGPGGWEQGSGRSDIVGLEWDAAACQTAKAAGHARIRCDVSTYPTEPFKGIAGLIASPPCQAWSMAGKRKGEQDRDHCHVLADRMAGGDDSTSWTDWEDPRSPLVCQPVRWVRDLMPEWVALEDVPAVASLWEHFARIFRRWGYSVWTGGLCAADYGVPQTRTRRILMASRTMTVQPPAPTHAQYPADGADLFGDQLEGWVSMATALGWDHGLDVNTRGERKTPGGNEFSADRASWAVTGKTRSWVVDRRTNSRAARGATAPTVPVSTDRPAPTFTGKSGGQWVVRPEFLRMGNQTGSTVRHASEPASTVLFGHRSNKTELVFERPATTVVGSYCPDVISPPGYRTQVSRQNAEGGVRVTVAEGGVLQSFPADYPWQGSRTAQYQQVGNAIPPRLAAHIFAALGVGTIASERVA